MKGMQTNNLTGFQTEGNWGDWYSAGFFFFAKYIACLASSEVMKEHHQHSLLRETEKEGQRGTGQAVSTSAWTEIRGCCTAAVMNSAAH